MTDLSPAETSPPAGDGPHLDESDDSKGSAHGVADSPRVVAADKEAGDNVSVMSQVSIDPPAGPSQSAYGVRGGSSVSSQRSLGDPPDKSGSIGTRVNRNEGYRKKRGTNTRASIHNTEMNHMGQLHMEGGMSSGRNEMKLHNKINRQTLEPLVENCELHNTGYSGTGIPVDNSHKRKPSTSIESQFDEESVAGHSNVSINSKYVKIASQNKTFLRSSSSGSRRRKRGTMKVVSKLISKYTSKQMMYIAILSVLVMACVFSVTDDMDDTKVVDMRPPTGGIMEDARLMENGRKILTETPAEEDEGQSQSHAVEDIERERRGGITERLNNAPPHLRGFYAKQMGISDPMQIVESVNPEIGGAATMQDISDPKPLEVVNTPGILSQLQYRQKQKTLHEKIQDGQDMLAAISQQVEDGQRDGQFGNNPLPPYFAEHVEVPSVVEQQPVTQNEQGPPPPVEQQQIQDGQQIMDGQAFEAHLQSQAFNAKDQPIMNPEILLPVGAQQQEEEQQQQSEEVDQSQQQTIEASLESIEAELAEFLPAPEVEGKASEGAE